MSNIKTEYVLECPFDEFNYYPVVNFYKEHFLDNLTIIIFKGLESLYPKFNHIISIDMPNDMINLSPLEKNSLIKDKLNKLTVSKVISYLDCIQLIHPNIHVYKYLFSNYTKYLIENKSPLFKTDIINNDFTDIKIPIVCINGRNINRNDFRNNLLELLIKDLINNDIFVINTTLQSPNFNFDKNYIEPKDLISFNKQLEYFKISDYVISVSDSSGVSTIMMSDCNLIMIGEGGWVDNNEFGYDNHNMLSARIKYLNKKTYRLKEYTSSEIINLIKEQ